MRSKNTSLTLKLNDLPCEVVFRPEVSGIDVSFPNDLEEYFSIQEDKGHLTVVQKKDYWINNPIGFYDLLNPKKLIIKVSIKLEEFQATISSRMCISGASINDLSFQAHASSVRISNSFIDTAMLTGYSCSFKLSHLGVMNRLTADYKMGSLTWIKAPQSLDLTVSKVIGKAASFGKQLTNGSVIKTSSSPKVVISCDGGSAALRE